MSITTMTYAATYKLCVCVLLISLGVERYTASLPIFHQALRHIKETVWETMAP